MPKGKQPRRQDKYLTNEQIRFPEVRLINAQNEQEGVVHTHHARNMAMEAQLDLVCITKDANPPVCKIIDYNKWQYLENQRAKESARKQRANRTELKEFQFRLTIDKHDKDVKIKNIWKHMAKGAHIRCVLQLRGRERGNIPHAKDVFTGILDDIGSYETVAPLSVSGNKLIQVIKKDGTQNG